jgi:hypothetical protein
MVLGRIMLGSISMRVVWLAIALIFGFVVGVSTAILAHLNGAGLSKAVLLGGASFGSATIFLIGLLQFVGT